MSARRGSSGRTLWLLLATLLLVGVALLLARGISPGTAASPAASPSSDGLHMEVPERAPERIAAPHSEPRTTRTSPQVEPEADPVAIPAARTATDDYEARYSKLSKAELSSKGMEVGDTRIARMFEIAEQRFRDGRYEVRGQLARGEKTPLLPADGPLVIERVLPGGEYQVVEFSPDEYPDLYASRREQDWLFAEANRRP